MIYLITAQRRKETVLSLDVYQIAESTGLGVRLIRYVLEHRVLPGSERHSKGHRITRYFTGFEAFATATAAALLHAGLRRSIVADCLRCLATTPMGSRSMDDVLLHRAYSGRGEAWLDIGDAVAVRLKVGGFYRPIETKWLSLVNRREVAIEPLVISRLDLARLRDPIRQASGE